MSSPEDLLALGAIFIVVFAVLAVLALFMMAWTLQLAAGMIGTKPTYLGCVGTLLGISAINGAIIAIGQVSLGAENAWMVAPVTWFVTVFMVAKLADCGLIKGFFIWIVNSFFATLGMVVLMMVTLIPIAMLGGGLESTFQELAAKMEAQDSEEAFDFETGDGPGLQSVGYGPSSNPFGSDSDEDESPSDLSNAFFESDEPAEFSQETESEQPAGGVATRSGTTAKKNPTPVQPRRAKDGSTLNPFFNQ